jgi:hypothetical protein
MMNNYLLFLDDIRFPEEVYKYTNNPIYLLEWEIIRKYNDFIEIIKTKGIPQTISFDHDLSDFDNNQSNEKTGYDCAKWFVDYCIDSNLNVTNEILLHSMNPVGRKNIRSIFDSYWKVYGK